MLSNSSTLGTILLHQTHEFHLRAHYVSSADAGKYYVKHYFTGLWMFPIDSFSFLSTPKTVELFWCKEQFSFYLVLVSDWWHRSDTSRKVTRGFSFELKNTVLVNMCVGIAVVDTKTDNGQGTKQCLYSALCAPFNQTCCVYVCV